MQSVLRVATAALLVQCAAAFKPSQVPRKSVELNSLIDEAYDVPSISQSYSRSTAEAATKASGIAKGIPNAAEKLGKGMPKYDVSEAATKAQAATTEASAKVSEATAQVSSAVDEATTKVSEASAQVSSAVDEFVKAASENFPAAKTTVSTGLAGFKPMLSPLDPSNFPKIAPAPPLEPGKSRTLIGYFREKVEDGSLSLKAPDADTVTNAKTKFALMVSNTYELFGKDAPQSIPTLPEGSAGWIATAVVSLVALGQRNAGVAEAKAAMGDMVQKEASAVSEIAKQLKSMEKEIKQLNKETTALGKELQAAKSKLTEKELALSKEKLGAADKELKLNRSVDQLQRQLAEAQRKLGAIDDTIKVEATSSPVASAVEEIATTVEEIATTVEEITTEAPLAPKKAKAKPKGQPKTVRVVKGATKGAPTPAKKSVKGEKMPAKKATAKLSAKPKAAKTPKTSQAESWSSLSPYKLSRKTVKQLTEYLSTQGVPTTDDDGKVLKKALLVEAVQAVRAL